MMSSAAISQRIVLIDFDWQDADLVPRLLAEPGVLIRMVTGENAENAGMRLAEMCGLPHSADLGDLTREIFDVALVSDRSPRRVQVEGLLAALGTPCCSPSQFLEQPATELQSVDTMSTDMHELQAKAVALENALSGREMEALMAEALPESNGAQAETAPPAPRKAARIPILEVLHLEDFPSPEDRKGLENALRQLALSTGADHVELRMGTGDPMEMVVEVGHSDPVTAALVEVASHSGVSQILEGLAGQFQGRAFGAWPFRTTQRRGVLAATGFDPRKGWQIWQRLVDELRSRWGERDRERAAPAFPWVPGQQVSWSRADDFDDCLQLAVERNGRDGLRFSLHRIDLPQSPAAVEILCSTLRDQLRDRDLLTRPDPLRVLLLTTSSSKDFPRVKQRILKLWEQACREARVEPPVPALQWSSLELASAQDGTTFLASARSWLAANG